MSLRFSFLFMGLFSTYWVSLSSFYRRVLPCLIVTCSVVLVCCLLKACSFLKGNEWGVYLEERVMWLGELEGNDRQEIDWDVFYERIIQFQ